MKTVVIIPAYNEESNIRSVATNVKRCYPQADIAVVNDGSTDRTSQVARESGATVVSTCRSTVMRRAGIYFFFVDDTVDGRTKSDRSDLRLPCRQSGRDPVVCPLLPSRLPRSGSDRPARPPRLSNQRNAVLMRVRQSGKSSITPFRSLYYMMKVSLAVMMTRIRSAS